MVKVKTAFCILCVCYPLFTSQRSLSWDTRLWPPWFWTVLSLDYRCLVFCGWLDRGVFPLHSCRSHVLQGVENFNTRLLLISCSQGILSSSSFSCYLLLRLLVYMYLSQLMRTFTNYLKCIVISS